MPNPKDPEKLAAYREKMRRIALERGFGKWMTGRKQPPEVVEKMSQIQKERGNDPEERKRRSERAKAKGYGKWMAGRPAHAGVIEYARSRKGKNYEEIYGEERAVQERESRKVGNKIAKAGQRPEHLLRSQRETAIRRKGKTYAEIYGDQAAEESTKRRNSHRKRWEGRARVPHRRQKHNSDHLYKDWRRAVFERDNYTCQCCARRGISLQAHHIHPWANYPELRYDVDNGQILCISCHKLVHNEKKI